MDRTMFPEIRDCEHVDAARSRASFCILVVGIGLLLISLSHRPSSPALVALFSLLGAGSALERLANFLTPHGAAKSEKRWRHSSKGVEFFAVGLHFRKVHLVPCGDDVDLDTVRNGDICAFCGRCKLEGTASLISIWCYRSHDMVRSAIQPTWEACNRSRLRRNSLLAFWHPPDLCGMGCFPFRGGM